jgi:hypothetical protein
LRVARALTTGIAHGVVDLITKVFWTANAPDREVTFIMEISSVQRSAMVRLTALLVYFAWLTSVASAYELDPDSTGMIFSHHGEILV